MLRMAMTARAVHRMAPSARMARGEAVIPSVVRQRLINDPAADEGNNAAEKSAIGFARGQFAMHGDGANDRIEHHAAERGDAESDAR